MDLNEALTDETDFDRCSIDSESLPSINNLASVFEWEVSFF